MKLYTGTQSIAVWLIVLVVAASCVNLALETRDILQLYSTISELSFTVSNLVLQPNSTTTVVLAVLRADNPGEYGALEATQVSFSAYFSSGASYLFQANPLIWGRMVSNTIASKKSTTWNFTVTLDSQDANALNSFYQNHNRDVTANVSTQVLVTTSFLYSFTGAIFYKQGQNLTLTSNGP